MSASAGACKNIMKGEKLEKREKQIKQHGDGEKD